MYVTTFLKKPIQLHASQGENGQTVHTVQNLADVQGEVTSVDFNNVTEAAINQEGQLILTSDDGHGTLILSCSLFRCNINARTT